MTCICCLSKEIVQEPLGLSDYFYCKSCGFVFQQRKKSDDQQKEIVEHYQKDDPHYAVANSKQAFFRQAINYLSTQVFENKPSLLDVGCGYGYFLDFARERGWETSGVEITGQAAIAAQEKFGKESIFIGQLRRAEFPADSFDAVTLWDVLVMVENPAMELKECCRILKPGGMVGIRVRNVLFQKFAYHTYKPLQKIGQKFGFKYPSVFHPYCFSSKSIESLLARLGFANIQIANSPLTTGDPYQHSGSKNIITISKLIISWLSKLIYLLSCKKWIVGPSLLIWAKKTE